MTSSPSLMRQEILEIPAAVDRLLSLGASQIQAAAQAVRDLDPRFVVTVARGSSDHVCSYLKYATELLLGVPVASVGPSVASIYGATLRLNGSLCLSVSQSGQSPDIVEMVRAASRGNALSVAITNQMNSPLATAADHALNMHAGPELSVAATKTFVTSAVAGICLLAEWRDDDDLRRAIRNLPKVLESATAIDWPEVRAAIVPERSLYTLGRGPVWAISNEAALKFKETCQIHAESYSSAEVLHGPVSIVNEKFPVLAFAAGDAAENAVVDIADQLAAKGANVFVTSARAKNAMSIDHCRTEHPLTDPISLITSFYAMVEKVATDRGINPDSPRHLKKVTETI